jgi:hypothetical protein
MSEGEVEGHYPEEILKTMRITPEVYNPMHKLIRPSWVSKVEFKHSFLK